MLTVNCDEKKCAGFWRNFPLLSKNLRRNFGGFRELQLFAETVEGIFIPISILVTDPSFQPSFSQLIPYSNPKIIITDSLFQPHSYN